MKAPRLIDGEWVVKKTLTIPVHLYAEFEKETRSAQLTPSELISQILTHRYPTSKKL